VPVTYALCLPCRIWRSGISMTFISVFCAYYMWEKLSFMMKKSTIFFLLQILNLLYLNFGFCLVEFGSNVG
jgi:hypothetical protein